MRLAVLNLVIVIYGTTLSGCALPYYWQAAAGQLELLRQRVPIEEVLNDPDQDADTRASLFRVVQIRNFAVEELDLPDSDSYQSYVELGRPYVVWNVVAAEEFSIEARRWCFPIAGCVTYRGYFNEQDAERYADELKADGLDTYIAGASAYSTLGYFADPILSTMLTGGESYIASLIFHELAHQRAYIPGETELNEAFATAVAEHGTRLWLLRAGDQQALAANAERQARREGFYQLVAGQQNLLRVLYDGEKDETAMRSAKSEAIVAMRMEYQALREAWGGASDYDAWIGGPLNNAQLASVSAYSQLLPGFREFIRVNGLVELYAEMDRLEALSPDARQVRVESQLAAAAAPELR
jgi:predicted aminopeptidase